MNLQNDDMIYWLAALRLEGIGSVRLRHWLEKFSDLKKLFTASVSELQGAGFSQQQIQVVKNPDWSAAEKDLLWCAQNNCHVVRQIDHDYPPLLREIFDAPLVLFVLGEKKYLSSPQLAIVGSRHPTVIGRELAEQFAFCLAQAGLVITSGLASGIDAASHQGALAAEGKTLAVCGAGLQHIYPPSNQHLAKQIQASGALISEFPPSFPPKPRYFPMRNRVISGLSVGVLVVEAALKSGSLITARLAAEQGRDVFALPGSIHNPLARGCHLLIQEGAKLIEKAEDILIEIGVLAAATYPSMSFIQRQGLDDRHSHLLAQIGYEITTLDAIILRSGLTAREVSSMLLSLELKGYAQMTPGGYVRCA